MENENFLDALENKHGAFFIFSVMPFFFFLVRYGLAVFNL